MPILNAELRVPDYVVIKKKMHFRTFLQLRVYLFITPVFILNLPQQAENIFLLPIIVENVRFFI